MNFQFLDYLFIRHTVSWEGITNIGQKINLHFTRYRNTRRQAICDYARVIRRYAIATYFKGLTTNVGVYRFKGNDGSGNGSDSAAQNTPQEFQLYFNDTINVSVMPETM